MVHTEQSPGLHSCGVHYREFPDASARYAAKDFGCADSLIKACCYLLPRYPAAPGSSEFLWRSQRSPACKPTGKHNSHKPAASDCKALLLCAISVQKRMQALDDFARANFVAHAVDGWRVCLMNGQGWEKERPKRRQVGDFPATNFEERFSFPSRT